jgi:hypothetical protein
LADESLFVSNDHGEADGWTTVKNLSHLSDLPGRICLLGFPSSPFKGLTSVTEQSPVSV